jgi:hypothetical protein
MRDLSRIISPPPYRPPKTHFSLHTAPTSPEAAQHHHTPLSHLDKRNTYVRMLFIDHSSALSTTVPSKLIIKLEALGLNPDLCNWVLDFDGPPPGGEGRKQHLHFADPQHWRPHKGVCSVPSFTPCSPTTAWPCTPPTQSSCLQTTQH